MTKVSSSRR